MAASPCNGLSNLSIPLLAGDSARGCPQRAVRIDACPCCVPVPADSRLRGARRDPCPPVPLLPSGSRCHRPPLCQAFPGTRLAQSILPSSHKPALTAW